MGDLRYPAACRALFCADLPENMPAPAVRLPVRRVFAAILFSTALVLLGLVVCYYLVTPLTVLEFAFEARTWIGYALWALAILALLCLAYPPTLPFLRMWIQANWRLLGTDRGPLHDGLARIRNFETHADRLAVGRIARQLRDYPHALENLTRAHEMEPDHVATRYQLALLLIEMRRFAEAADLLRGAVETDESHAFGDGLFHLAHCLHRLHRDDEALESLRRHQQLFPGNRSVHLLAAKVLAARGDLDAARIERTEARRPAGAAEHLSPADRLARARALVTPLHGGARR